MTEQSGLPRGGIDARKYAAICLALGLARGAIYEALEGNTERAQQILDITSTARIAQALGCSESDLAIVWDDHLTRDEVSRIKEYHHGFGS